MAPWCHHCRDVWPEWNLASKHYDLPKDVEVHFGKVNCETHHEMCARHHIRYVQIISCQLLDLCLYRLSSRRLDELSG